MLTIGSSGPDVVALQQRLQAHGHRLRADGVFGPATQRALIASQRQFGLKPDGVYGPQTHSRLAQPSNALTQAASLLGVDLASIHAIRAVESRGAGFLPDGRPKILFERHIFYRQLSQRLGVAAAKHHVAQQPQICHPQTGGYLGGVREYDRLAQAQLIHAEAALKSASWGAFQIMGFNHEACGHPDVFAFVTAMQQDEDQHLFAFCHFIKAHKLMHQALKDRNWATFARLYNGPGYAKHGYHTRLAKAYQDAKT